MRVATASALIVHAVSGWAGAQPVSIALNALSLVTGTLLLAGLWTPVAGVLAAVCAGWNALGNPGDARFYVLLGIVGIALALLGPGVWSIDARRFGWKRVEIRNGSSRGNGTRKQGTR